MEMRRNISIILHTMYKDAAACGNCDDTFYLWNRALNFWVIYQRTIFFQRNKFVKQPGQAGSNVWPDIVLEWSTLAWFENKAVLRTRNPQVFECQSPKIGSPAIVTWPERSDSKHLAKGKLTWPMRRLCLDLPSVNHGIGETICHCTCMPSIPPLHVHCICYLHISLDVTLSSVTLCITKGILLDAV